METGLRILLLLMGVLVVVGVVWDYRRHRNKSRSSEETSHEYESESAFDEAEDLDYVDKVYEEVAIRKVSTKPQPKRNTPEQTANEQIVMLRVMAKPGQNFLGPKILLAFKSAFLNYGALQIFHRHQNTNGTGEVLFSATSAIEPGHFEMAKIQSFATPGINLFFVLQNPSQRSVFEIMLKTAKQLAMALNGVVKDEQNRSLTPEIITAYRQRFNWTGKSVFSTH